MNQPAPITACRESQMSSPIVLIIGIVVALLGAAFIAGWFDWLLDVLGFILVIIGIIAIVMGVMGMFGNRGRSGGY